MIYKNTGYAYSDLTLVPKRYSNINSRRECNCTYENGMLPIFASCMDTVVNPINKEIFEENKITPIIPRNIDIISRRAIMNEGGWVALSLSEFSELFIDEYTSIEQNKTYYICVDIANGHMKKLYDTCKIAKRISQDNNYNLILMTGNIANPETYLWICENYPNIIDYIRVGIGGGLGCTTASNTGTFYPMASLIDECYKIKRNFTSVENVREGLTKDFKNYNIYKEKYHKSNENDTNLEENDVIVHYTFPKIIADGGIRNYNDVIKALALGADYVMIGGLFASMYESASPLLLKTDDGYIETDYEYTNEEKKRSDIKNRNLYKEFYGMSTKKAQKNMGNTSLKTAEGRCTYQKVQYTLSQWCDNMKAYLKSAMSYQGAYDLYQFIGSPMMIPNSVGAVMSVNK